jgi:hypothetical protein
LNNAAGYISLIRLIYVCAPKPACIGYSKIKYAPAGYNRRVFEVNKILWVSVGGGIGRKIGLFSNLTSFPMAYFYTQPIFFRLFFLTYIIK